MNHYVGYVTLPQHFERNEAQRRIKEAKRDEWVTAAKYFQSWERQSEQQDKWESASASSTSTANSCCSDHGANSRRTLDMDLRRTNLQLALDSESTAYQAELRVKQEASRSNRIISNGVTANFVKQTDGDARPIPEKCDRSIDNYIQERRHLSPERDPLSLQSTKKNYQCCRNHNLNCRRKRLRELLSSEQEQFDRELKSLNSPRSGSVQSPTGISKNELGAGFKVSDDYSNRVAFLSGAVNSRRKEELAHYSVAQDSSATDEESTTGKQGAAYSSEIHHRSSLESHRYAATTQSDLQVAAAGYKDISSKSYQDFQDNDTSRPRDNSNYNVFRFW